MSKRLLSFILVWHCLTSASGELADPIIDYARRVMDEQKSHSFGYWESSMMNQPPGGMIVRFKFDVNGDEREDLFLSSTISTDEKWALYIASEEGYLESLDSVYLGDFPGAFIRKENEVLYMTDVFSRATWISIVENRFLSNGRVEATLRRVEGYNEAQNFQRQEGWLERTYGQRVLFENAEICSLRSILLNPNAQWYLYSFEYALRSQHQSLSRETRLALFSEDFTPDVALKVLESRVRASADAESDVVPTAEEPDDEEADFRVRVGPEEFPLLLEDGDYGNLDMERLIQTVNNLFAHVYEFEIATDRSTAGFTISGQEVETNRYLEVPGEVDYRPEFESYNWERLSYHILIEDDGEFHLLLSQGFIEAFIDASKYAEVTDELNEFIERINRIRSEELESLTEAQIDSIQYVDPRLLDDPSPLEKKRNYLKEFTLDVHFLDTNVFWIIESAELGQYVPEKPDQVMILGEAIYYATEDMIGSGWSREEGIYDIPPPANFDPGLHADSDSGQLIWVPNGTWGFIYIDGQWKLAMFRPGT